MQSKEINPEERRNLQEKLKKVLNDINFNYNHYICSRFCITLGDEFQGGLYSSYYLFDIIKKIQTFVSPYRLRIGIGIGEMSTDIKYNDSFGSDGLAYHLARKEIELLKGIKTYEYGYAVSTGESDTVLLNHLFRTIDGYSAKWTESQKKYIFSINKRETLESVAKRLNVSISTVSRALKISQYSEINKIISDIRDYLFQTYTMGKKQDNFILGYNKACQLFEDKEYNKALEKIVPPKEDSQADLIIYNILLGNIYYGLKMRDKSLECMQSAYKLIDYNYRQRKVLVLNRIGIIYSQMRKADLALEAYKEALEIIEYESDLQVERLSILGNEAILYSRCGQYEEAEQLYKEVYNLIRDKLDNNHIYKIRLLENRGKNLIEMGETEKAKEVFCEAVTISDTYVDQNMWIVAESKYCYADILAKEDKEKYRDEILKLLIHAKEIYKKNKREIDVEKCEKFINSFN